MAIHRILPNVLFSVTLFAIQVNAEAAGVIAFIITRDQR